MEINLSCRLNKYLYTLFTGGTCLLGQYVGGHYQRSPAMYMVETFCMGYFMEARGYLIRHSPEVSVYYLLVSLLPGGGEINSNNPLTNRFSMKYLGI